MQPRRLVPPAVLLAVLAAALVVATTPATAAASAPDEPGDPGAWSVTAVGQGRYLVAWTSPTPLPADSDRPTITGAGLRFGPPTIAGDGRTVEAVVTAAQAPDPAVLDVVLSGDRLDEPGLDPAAGARVAPSAPRPTTPLPAADPGRPGPYEVTNSDYRLPGVKVPGLPRPVEMVGHVVEPAADADTGPRPLVLFLHGRHGVCYDPDDDDAYSETWPCSGRFEEIPSHLGYVHTQRLLASHGFATVSVRVNGINAQDDRLDDGGADARAGIVARHLDHWVGLAAGHQVDLDQVVLVGHSRGGEGVDRASIEIPRTAPYRIAGQVLLAPTDFASHTAPYVPTVTVLPYCDGDVYDIQGQRFTDTGRDLTADDTSLKSSVLVMGANHNFFNTEWTPGTAVAPSSDDWSGSADEPCGRKHPGRLKAPQQRAVGNAYVAGAVRLFTGEDAYLPLFDGSPVTVASIGAADVRTHAIGGGRSLRRPGIDATPTLPRGGADTRLCVGVASPDPGAFGVCGRAVRTEITPHWILTGEGAPSRRFLEMSWTRAGASGGLRFGRPLDLSTDRLELRTIVDPRRGPVDLRVRVTDGAGGSAVLVPEGGSTVRPLLTARYLTKLWGQALLVDASGASGLDLTDIRSVELVGGTGGGRVWVADVASAPAAPAEVPDVRLPQVNLGDLAVAEGDPSGGAAQVRRVARVPFTITGDVTAPARFAVLTTGQERGTRHRFTVDVAPGQTRGTIPVAYTADRLHGFDAETVLSVRPVRGIATDDYLGRLRVRDDDPDPRVRVRSPQVREGAPIEFRIRLSKPVEHDTFAVLGVVRGPGEDLRGRDVPSRWLRRVVGAGAPPRHPLWRSSVYLDDEIRAGDQQVTLVVPTRKDGVREGPEKLTVRLLVGDQWLRRTVTVRDAR